MRYYHILNYTCTQRQKHTHAHVHTHAITISFEKCILFVFYSMEKKNQNNTKIFYSFLVVFGFPNIKYDTFVLLHFTYSILWAWIILMISINIKTDEKKNDKSVTCHILEREKYHHLLKSKTYTNFSSLFRIFFFFW